MASPDFTPHRLYVSSSVADRLRKLFLLIKPVVEQRPGVQRCSASGLDTARAEQWWNDSLDQAPTSSGVEVQVWDHATFVVSYL